MSPRAQRSSPRTRTPRAEGMAHMVEATIRLLQDRSPDHITVRDVAEASGHHHRFVQAWFGGKVGLFRAAFDKMLLDAAERMPRPFAPHAGFSPDVRATAGLMNWLMAADPGSLDGPRTMPIVERLIAVYRQDFGLDADIARLMALRVVGTAVSAILFSGPLGLEQDDVTALALLELELAKLLSAARSSAG